MLSISNVAPTSLSFAASRCPQTSSLTVPPLCGEQMIQTGLFAAKFLQPAAVLLSVLSIQSSDSLTAKIPLASAISTFALEYFYWLTVLNEM